jgi:hypothetical protein
MTRFVVRIPRRNSLQISRDHLGASARGGILPRMKKTNTHSKLLLKLETVKGLTADDLKQVAGGATTVGHGCAQPTTTVLPTGDC